MATSNAIIWNDNQKKVINNREGNMLVSASAGSGKTTVMLERALEIIKAGTPINRICILAFNNSIAGEIRQKLYRKILEEIENLTIDDEKYSYLCEQLDNINQATILTNDAFCGKVVREFFQLLGLDTNSELIGDLEEKSLYSESFVLVLEELKNSGEAWIFELINKFGSESELEKQIDKINRYAKVHPDKSQWINNIKNGVYNVELKNSKIMQVFLEMLAKRCDFALAELMEIHILADSNEKYRTSICAVEELFRDIKRVTDYEKLNTLVSTTKFPSRVSINKNSELIVVKEDIAYHYDNAKSTYQWLTDYVSKNYNYLNDIHTKTSVDVMRLFEVYEGTDKAYLAKKRRANKTDFSEISAQAVRILSDSAVAKDMRERYDYVCVDEYQDTNYLQEYMFNQVSNGHNLFMVGDSKQSIYRFRMSEPSILISKYDAYAKESSIGSTVHLDDNYRSDKGIIEFVNDIFNVIMTKNIGGVDYANTDRLGYGAKYIELNELPAVDIAMFVEEKQSTKENRILSKDNVYSVATSELDPHIESVEMREAEYIAKHIKSIVGKKKIYDITIKAERYIRYSDCVILSSSGGDKTKKIMQAIQAERIPVDASPLVKVDKMYEVEILNEWLRVIDNDMQDIPLSAVLVSFWGDMNYQDLVDIKARHIDCEFYYQACEKESDSNSKLVRLYGIIHRLRIIASSMTVVEILKALVYDYGYDKHLMTRTDGEFRLNAVESYIQAVGALGKGTSLSEYIASCGDFKLESAPVGGGDVVRAMTIHKSKGLEFPIVYLCNSSDSINKAKGFNTPRLECHNDIGIAINYFDENKRLALNNFAFKVLKEKIKFEQFEEKMRLFYVALTRAKNHLVITGTASSTVIVRKNPYKVNSFWEWIALSAVNNYRVNNCIKFYEGISPKENIMEQFTFRRTSEEFPEIAKTLDYIYPNNGAVHTHIKYSVTEINSLNQYEDALINVLDSTSEEEIFSGNKALRGTNYHAILEHINYDALTRDAIEEQLQAMLASGIITEEDLASIDIDEIAIVLNSDIIGYARENKHYREREFMLCVGANEVLPTECMENILVQGAIDLIIDGKELIVVDFKKSNASTETLKMRYRKQLELYAMATEEALGRRVDRKMLYLIGRNETIEFR